MPTRERRGNTLAQLEKRLHQLNAERQAILADIKKAVEQLSFGSAAPMAGISVSGRLGKGKGGRRPGFKLSAEARAKIAAAQRARWARVKSKKS
jgi:hypothetical protein